jgi:hypothetical protein
MTKPSFEEDNQPKEPRPVEVSPFRVEQPVTPMLKGLKSNEILPNSTGEKSAGARTELSLLYFFREKGVLG